MRKGMNVQAMNIDADMIKRINMVLEEDKPAGLIKTLECFIALLRNKLSANHIDVKLYLLDHSKLQFKLRTIDAKKLSYDVVKKHGDTIEQLEKSGECPEEFEDILEWSKNFSSYAEYHLDAVKYENDKKDLMEEMSHLENDLNTKNELL